MVWKLVVLIRKLCDVLEIIFDVFNFVYCFKFFDFNDVGNILWLIENLNFKY